MAYLLDGAMHNDPYDNSNLPFPFPDALQEFSVATSGLSAQNGMHSGASVNAVTKSGTNGFHGNAFEFLRDQPFQRHRIRSRASDADGKQVDDGLVRNQFGGTLGGPIVRDKLFFFGGYQGTMTRQTPAVEHRVRADRRRCWPATSRRFASPACNDGRQMALRAPFVNNRIDPALFSPAAVKIAEAAAVDRPIRAARSRTACRSTTTTSRSWRGSTIS